MTVLKNNHYELKRQRKKKSDSCYFILPVLHKLHIFGINTSNISSLFTTTLHLTKFCTFILKTAQTIRYQHEYELI